MAKIYDKGPGEHVIINAVREQHVRVFQATDWLDLRVGFFLSLCGATDPGQDDTITVLAETIGTDPQVPWTDRIMIGLLSGEAFVGYTNLAGNRTQSIGRSKLVSSDIGIGTTNTNFWRPTNEVSDNDAVKIIDNGIVRASAADGSQPHFVQNVVGAGGYCTFFGLRLTRPNSSSRARIITMSVKKTAGGHSSDILFNSTPTNAIGETQLTSFPTTVQTLGPVELSQVPNTFVFYWPFHGSRLRIHEICLVKSA